MPRTFWAVFFLCCCTSGLSAQPKPVTLTLPTGQEIPSPTVPAPLTCVLTRMPMPEINAMVFAPDSRFLVVGGYREVVIWDTVEGKLARRLTHPELSERVSVLVFANKGAWLVIGGGTPGQKGCVVILDFNSGQPVAVFKEPPDVVQEVAVSPDNRWLAAGGAYKGIHLWNLADKKLIKTIDLHNDWTTGLSFSPDNQYLATAGGDRKVQIWKVPEWAKERTIPHKEQVIDLDFSPDSNFLAIATSSVPQHGIRFIPRVNFPFEDPSLKEKKDAKPQPRLPGVMRLPGNSIPQSLCWVPQAEQPFLAVGSQDGTVKFVFLRNQFPPPSPPGPVKTKLTNYQSFPAHQGAVHRVAASPDGTKIATAGADSTIRLYLVVPGKPTATLVQLNPNADRWVTLSSLGYFDSSVPETVSLTDSKKPDPPDVLRKQYHNPEALRRLLAGLTAFEPPPKVQPKPPTPPKVQPKPPPPKEQPKTTPPPAKEQPKSSAKETPKEQPKTGAKVETKESPKVQTKDPPKSPPPKEQPKVEPKTEKKASLALPALPWARLIVSPRMEANRTCEFC